MSSLLWTALTLQVATKLTSLTDYVGSLCDRCRFCRALCSKLDNASENGKDADGKGANVIKD